MRKARWLGWTIAALMVLVAAGALYLEALFRPPERLEPELPADRALLQGRISQAEGFIPFTLPGIAGARISIEPGGHAATAGPDGRFSVGDISPGVYTLSLSASGFEPVVLSDVALPGGAVTTLPEQPLFPAINGPPVARLKLGSLAPFARPPKLYPYGTAVYLDGSDSENISRAGIRFEIRNERGELLIDPYSATGDALQPDKPEIPGTSPALFVFKPPAPGEFTVRVILAAKDNTGEDSWAEVRVRAINTPPAALPSIIAGPAPPQKIPGADRRVSSGLQVVRLGEKVFLMGRATDANHASPERYNPGGNDADAYGKNHDHGQRQFDFRWRLFYGAPGEAVAMDDRLMGPDGGATENGQVVHFLAAQPGRYEAQLSVSDNDPSGALTSEAAAVSVLVVADDSAQDGSACSGCHAEQVARHGDTAHGLALVGCDRCHGPAAAHLAVTPGSKDYEQRKRVTQDVSRDAGVCGQCHDVYPEWEKSRHADGMPYGHLEIARPLLVQCSKCHYAKSFAATLKLVRDEGVAFHDIDYKIRPAGIGPLMPDFSKVPAAGETGISCVACHDPHSSTAGAPAGLRTESAGALCQTCHEEKWQNAVLEGTAAEVHNGYEYPGQDYAARNPHATTKKCVRCHLDNRTTTTDARGVRAVGGHTLRMRDAGPNGVLEGAGEPGDGDDVLNLAPCQDCHPALASFDRDGVQSEMHARWTELGQLLRTANNGVLPGFKPGDKCATCHRGGTLPFDEDPALVLESAYLNYKLVRNDRSWGIHNPPYVRKLLDDSIESVRRYLASRDVKRDAAN